MLTIEQRIAQELSAKEAQVIAAITLLDEGATMLCGGNRPQNQRQQEQPQGAMAAAFANLQR